MPKRSRLLLFIFSVFVLFMSGCAINNSYSSSTPGTVYRYKRNVVDYEKYGFEWGKRFYNNKPRITPEFATGDLKRPVSLNFMWNLIRQDELAYYWGQCNDMNGDQWKQSLIKEGYVKDGYFTDTPNMDAISRNFIAVLILNHNGLNFFGVNTDLKEAFKKGFREGYQDRTADLVLGPYLQKAGGIVGDMTALGFVSIINKFEKGWKVTLERAVNVFIELIADGSQAEREQFIKDFIKQYKKKYLANREIITTGIPLTSEGGTQLFLDPKRTQSALNIPSDKAIKDEIYYQTFVVMGDEMGRRYSHNLISHEDLVDWLRRSKLALNMDSDSIDNRLILHNLNAVKKNFASSYGIDGGNVFNELKKEAGYNDLH